MTWTADRTIRRGPELAGGWRDLEHGPGAGWVGTVAEGAVPLATLWHLSDLHLCDAESPVRLEFLDRYGDPHSKWRDDVGPVGTYRPQEILTVQVAVAMVETVNALTHGPVLGRAVDAAVVTGDVVDNAQRNELDWYHTVIRGGTVVPASGDPTRSSWVGATHPERWSEHYWHPDGPPEGVPDDLPTRLYGFPRIPGLIAAARRAVLSPGLGMPCLTVHGNHDLLLQGSTPPSDVTRELAVGGRRVVGLATGQTPWVATTSVPETGPSHYPLEPDSPTEPVTPDPARRLLEPGEFGPLTWWSDIGGVRVIAIDTVNPHGGWQGSVTASQLDWLTGLLADADRPVVIASHHPSWCMTNDYAPRGEEPRLLADDLIRVLVGSPWVVAWLAGHTHLHGLAHHGPEGRGLWEFTTPSLVDWPQQARVFEFALEPDGRVAIVSTVVDHHSPVRWSAEHMADHTQLASISRVLAANDYRTRDWQQHETPDGAGLNGVWRSRVVG